MTSHEHYQDNRDLSERACEVEDWADGEAGVIRGLSPESAAFKAPERKR